MASSSASDGGKTKGRAPPQVEQPTFTILEEEIKIQRYLTFYDRKVKFPPTVDNPEGAVHNFDVIGHPKASFHFCVTFPFHPPTSGRWQDGEVTLVREYAQGINEMVYCLPSGAFDPQKHSDYESCAMAELSEEVFLKGGSLSKLLPDVTDFKGVPEVKWCANRFTPFIVVNPQIDEQPGRRDVEEFIEVVRVTIPELRALMRSGSMLLPSVSTCWWAMEWLAERDGSDGGGS